VLELVLYGRPACHLCDEMADELAEILRGCDYQLKLEDVDSRPDWRERYGPRVPVLILADGTELCHYRLDSVRVRALTPPSNPIGPPCKT
jgi:hypothetical protein